MQGRHRHRRALALMTCVLWLLGVEVLPNLHLALHRGDHTHGDDGTIVLSRGDHGDRDDHDDHDDADHDHDAVIDEHHDHDHDAVADEDHDHDHGHARAAHDEPADDAGDQPALDHPRHAHHQAGGVSHHAVALHRPPPPLLAPHLVARAAWPLEAATASRPRSAGIARPTSRGPPTV